MRYTAIILTIFAAAALSAACGGKAEKTEAPKTAPTQVNALAANAPSTVSPANTSKVDLDDVRSTNTNAAKPAANKKTGDADDKARSNSNTGRKDDDDDDDK